MNLPHSAIYDFAYADGAVVIGAEFKGRVHVYSAENFQKLRDFPVTFDFGGKRASVSARFPLVFCGCYARTGLGAYDYSTGAEVWRLKTCVSSSM